MSYWKLRSIALGKKPVGRLQNGEIEMTQDKGQVPDAHVQNPAEIEHVAGDVSKNGPTSNMAPQPSPTPPPAKVELFNPLEGGNPETALQMAAVIALRDSQPARDYPPLPEPQYQMGGKGHSDAAMRAYVDADRAARTQADSQPAMTPETVYAAIAHGDEEHRAWLLSALRAVWCGEAVPPVASPIANAAADSQPAPVEVVDAMADSQYLAGVSAGWNAANADDPNAALQKLQESRAGYLKPLRAARAPADSVTAPAGGANWQDISTAPKDGTRFVAVGQNYGLDSETQHTCIAQWLAGCWIEVSDWNGASKLKYLTHWMPLPPLPGSAARAPADSVTAPVNEAVAYLDIGAGGYIDLGTDLSEEALSRLPKGRHALTIAGTYGIDGYTPTTSADSVLEDAALLDWLALAGPVSICVVIDRPHDGEVEVATDDVTGYGKTLREALNAARKQGGAT